MIKVGGSLSESPKALESLGKELSSLANKHQFVVVPGGAKFADVVRELDERFCLPPMVSHRLAILAMDQYGLLLSHVFSGSEVCDSLRVLRQISGSGRVAIWLPSRMLLKFDPFEPSWDVTSDSIAAHIAYRLCAKKVIFVTDVDGIFKTDPKIDADARLLRRVSVGALLRFSERTSVDKFLPEFLTRCWLDCYVVNGRFPKRVAAVLVGQETLATRIIP